MKSFEARVVSVFIGKAGEVKAEKAEALHLDARGVIADRHYGIIHASGGRQKDYVPKGTPLINLRQVTIVTLPELRRIAERLDVPNVSGADLGANIVLDGPVNLTSFPAGINGILRFPSGLVLFCMGENEPCSGPGRNIARSYNRTEITNQFQRAAMHLRGIVAMVGTSGNGNGIIRPNDTCELFWPSWTGWKPE